MLLYYYYIIACISGSAVCLLQFYEAVYDCSLTPGSAKYPRQCLNPSRTVVRAPGYKQDAYVLYTVNAVYSAALGIHYALEVTILYFLMSVYVPLENSVGFYT